MKNLRILSLLPAATEIVYLLGLEKYLVGVSDECDYPKAVKDITKVTSSLVSNEMSSSEIDEKVKNLGHSGIGISHINQKLFNSLKPNLILTQELCEVCAIPFTEVKKASRILEGDIKIISLEPESIKDILANIKVVGENTEKKSKSLEVIKTLEKRLNVIAQQDREGVIASKAKQSSQNSNKNPWIPDQVGDDNEEIATGSSNPRNDDNFFLRASVTSREVPKILIIEWLEPLMVAGHWVPEMVARAGGKMLITKQGQRSEYISEKEIKNLNPDICIIAPCGFDIKRTLKEKSLIKKICKLLTANSKLFLMDGNSYLTRPGPRIIDGVEILSEIIHPEIFNRKYLRKDWQSYSILTKLHG